MKKLTELNINEIHNINGGSGARLIASGILIILSLPMMCYCCGSCCNMFCCCK